jgi:hypothetical protein
MKTRQEFHAAVEELLAKLQISAHGEAVDETPRRKMPDVAPARLPPAESREPKISEVERIRHSILE